MYYLVHHGIKGQKWGVRRYQNEDGTWTEAGKKHRGLKAVGAALGGGIVGGAIYANKMKKIRHEIAANQVIGEPKGTVKPFDDKSNNKKAAALNKGKGSVENIRQSRREQKKAEAQIAALDEAKNMTDEQLKKRTARLNLENNYVNAISQQQVNSGADTVDRILAYTGTALGLAASAVTIYGLVKGK